MEFKFSEQAKEWMANFAIPEDYVRSVIESAEKSGDKAVSVDGILNCAKEIIDEVTVYAIYRIEGEGEIGVEDVYSHRMKLLDKGQEEERD